MTEKEYMLGNAAIARGLLEGGLGLISGYPGTPSSEIIDTLRTVKDKDFYVEWSVNEKTAVETAIGGAFTGIRSAVTMKHVGLNVAADPLMTVAYAGVKGGLIIISADDPSFHSSQNEQDTRRYAEFALLPCFDPSTPQEAKDMIPYAFELSEKFEKPIIFRPTTRISHGKSDIVVRDLPGRHGEAKFEKDPTHWVMLPAHAKARHPLVIEDYRKIEAELEDSPWNTMRLRDGKADGKTIGVISSGIAAAYSEEVLECLKGDTGLDISFMKIGAYPFSEKKTAEFLRHCDKVLVVEELEPIVEDRVRIIAQMNGITTEILGKETGHVSRVNEFNTLLCSRFIRKAFTIAGSRYDAVDAASEKDAADESSPAAPVLPLRPPTLCAGCSHRSAYQAMKEDFGRNAIFPGDIGCYTLGIQNGTMDTTICMGASISIASGLSQAGEKNAICCSIGDSTFFHSGMNSLMNAVFNKAHITVAILDNRITAMTGHQPNPGVGKTAMGEDTYAVSIEDLCRAMGVAFIRVVDAYRFNDVKEAFREAKAFDGVSVVIVKQACVIAGKKSGIRRKPFVVETEKCKGCRRCINFGCPAIEFDREKAVARINTQCSGCGVCSDICSFDAIREVA
ncbi:indolepyruvate ferredoxin oxidoreductase subunit alpha [Methanosarcinaceae archaeon]|nr:indolepyruvate ferredoxin oxidoreductase subunit alpha [Methanosarcinaceae archaeon]